MKLDDLESNWPSTFTDWITLVFWIDQFDKWPHNLDRPLSTSLRYLTNIHPNLTVPLFAIGGVSWCWAWFKIFGIGIFEISCEDGCNTWLAGMGDFAVDCWEEDCWELKRLCEFCWESVKLSWECWECFLSCRESSRMQLSISWDNNSSVS